MVIVLPFFAETAEVDTIVWYLIVLGVLIFFLLACGFYELDCDKNCKRLRSSSRYRDHQEPRMSVFTISDEPMDSPPPPYELFAPPSYDIIHATSQKKAEDVELGISELPD